MKVSVIYCKSQGVTGCFLAAHVSLCLGLNQIYLFFNNKNKKTLRTGHSCSVSLDPILSKPVPLDSALRAHAAAASHHYDEARNSYATGFLLEKRAEQSCLCLPSGLSGKSRVQRVQKSLKGSEVTTASCPSPAWPCSLKQQ